MKRLLFLCACLISVFTKGQTVKIAAAADLRYAMDEIVNVYHEDNPHANIEVIYGSSGNAFTQILNGAPYDVYFSADKMYPEKLKDAGLTLTEPKLYAIGRIVIWSSQLDVSNGLNVLKEPKIRIATANPDHAPYGQRSVEYLKYAGVYGQVEKQIIYGENISQAAQFCLTGNADVGLLALSIVLSPNMQSQGKYFLIPANAHKPLEQAYVVLKHAAGNNQAFAFVEYVAGTEARAIFEKYGFTLPKQE
ncbi:MAG: molybdate ABC transporter substrate-binding protein [Prolixibacteraceae bacterium]|nr:molybdate ABC transporter substrate-binding protein [Prolixibacteraceae bacterium]